MKLLLRKFIRNLHLKEKSQECRDQLSSAVTAKQ